MLRQPGQQQRRKNKYAAICLNERREVCEAMRFHGHRIKLGWRKDVEKSQTIITKPVNDTGPSPKRGLQQDKYGDKCIFFNHRTNFKQT